MFSSGYKRIRIGFFACSLITISGYASENLNFTDSTESRNASQKFIKKFNSLVSRAYFKLVVEAERADIRLVNEYKRLYQKNRERMDDLAIQEEFTGIYKRFLTHRRMLAGLKSWRIFSETARAI